MTILIILAAILVTAALAVVLFPLLKATPRKTETASTELSLRVLREQLAELDAELQAGTLDAAQYEKERAEIERRAIEDGKTLPQETSAAPPTRGLAIGLVVFVVVLTAGLYAWLGTPTVLQTGDQHPNQQGAHALTPEQIQAMAAKLAERLQENPADGSGWLMLARSYKALGRYPESAAAYGRATTLLPEDAQTLSDFADVLAMAQGRRLQGEPEKIIQRALKVDPNHIKALALSGSVAFERQDYGGAAMEWQKILAVVPADSDVAARVRNNIADAESRAGKRGAMPSQSAASLASVRGVVSIDSKLRAQASDNDTVFVFARATSGPGMPLAITRLRVKDLPAQFLLDDSMGAGGPKLSQQSNVIIGARISRSGDATRRPGDLEGFSEAVPVGSQDIRIAITKPVT